MPRVFRPSGRGSVPTFAREERHSAMRIQHVKGCSVHLPVAGGFQHVINATYDMRLGVFPFMGQKKSGNPARAELVRHSPYVTLRPPQEGVNMTEHGSGFEQLTWDDVTSWAGAKILNRGKSYKRQVSDLRRTNDGGILAWVHGTKQYVTLVRRESSGTLSSVCSCPYDWTPCKHSVAVVLAYLDAVKSKQDVPQVLESDRRLKLITDLSSQEITDALWEEDEDDESEEDFPESEQGTAEKYTMHDGGSRSIGTRKGKRADVVRQRIEGMSRDQLVEFVINLVKEYPEIGRKIEEEESLKAGRVTKVVRSIRAEIEDVTSEPAWANYWSGEGSIPDYSRVRERLQSLLNSGHADEVVELGKYLWRLGNKQVESSDDEGETGSQISECMAVVSGGRDEIFVADSGPDLVDN